MASRALALASFTALALLVPGAAAQDRHLDFTAFDAGGDYWFDMEGTKGRNPELVLRPGDEVWVDIRSAAREDHNLRFGGPIDEAVELMPAGHTLAMRFVVPDEEGTYEYWCDPHRELGMRGTYRIEAASENAAMPLPAALALLALLVPLALRRAGRGGGRT